MVTEFLVGDCIEELTRIRNAGTRFRLGFADPPFNIGVKYEAHKDKMKPQEFEEWTFKWLDLLFDVVDGVVCVHGPDSVCEIALAYARAMRRKRIAWVNWRYDFGVCHRHHWIDARCHCLIFSTVDQHTWNPESVLIDSARKKSGDKRIADYANGGQRVPGTVWGIADSDGENWCRIQGTNRERWPEAANQLPLKYLARLVKAYTNPGDGVIDPFCGSGTTAIVSDVLGRHCLTIDNGPNTIASAKKRLACQRELAAERCC